MATASNNTSVTEATVTFLTLPSAPATVTANSITESGFILVWSQSLSAISYSVTVGTAEPVVVSGNTLYINTGLTSGTVHNISITATNATGVSTNTATTTVLTLPSSPAALATSTITQTGFTLTWTASTGASSYLVTVGDFTSTVTTNTAVVTGMLEGTLNTAVVRAINASGTSISASTLNVLTIPLGPPSVSITAIKETGFTISWPAATGATSYSVVIGGAAGVSVTGNTFYIATGLTAGTSYLVKVYSVNATNTSTNFGSITTSTLASSPSGLTIPTGNITATGAPLSWTGSTGATSYIITVGDNTYTTTGTSFNLTGLSPGTSNTININAVGVSGSSTSVTSSTILTLPVSPPSLTATYITESGFTVSWAPTSGTSAYLVTINNSSITSFSVSNSNSYSATSLSGGTNYTVTLYSSNATGSAATPVTLNVLTLSSAPANLAATSVAETGFSLTWTASAGAIQYLVNVDDFSSTVATSPAVITGMIPGNLNIATVRAINATGQSITVSTLIVQTIPAAPSTLSADNIRETTLTLLWSISLGASSYIVNIPGVVTNAIVTGNTVYYASGLTAGTTYAITVKAKNDTSNLTSTSTTTLNALTLANAPSGLAASSITQTTFVLSWSASTGATSYSVISGNYSAVTTGTSITVNGRLPGSNNIVTVRSINASGTSVTLSTLNVLNVPLPPSSLVFSYVTYNQFTVTWNPSLGAASYTITISTKSTAVLTGNSTTSFHATGLSPSTTYTVTLTSSNASGTSPDSTVVNVLTAPSPPTNVMQVAATFSSINVAWGDADGATSYAFLLGNYSNPSVTYSVANDTATLSQLSAATEYSLIVTAINDGGSTDSTLINIITAPGEPTNIRSTPVSNTSVTLNWQGGYGATSYSYLFNNTARTASVNNGVASQTATFTGLTPNTAYTVIVNATNSGGTTPSDGTFTFTTSPTTPVVSTPTEVVFNGFKITWTGGAGAVSYNYQLNTTYSVPSIDNGLSAQNATFSSLTESTTYSIIVTAVSPWGNVSSSPISVTTPAKPPPPVPTYEVNTLAGKAGVSAQTNGTGSAAAFSLPLAGSVDPVSGNLYVSDYGEYANLSNAIRQVTPAGVVTTVYSESRSTFISPLGSVVYNGSLYVVAGQYIYRFDLTSFAKTTFSTYLPTLPQYPGGYLAVDSAGNFYATRYDGGNIYKITSNGSSSVFISTSGKFVNGIAIDSSNNIYYTVPYDTGSGGSVGSIYKYNGSSSSVIASALTYPVGLTLSQDQTILYCSVSNDHTIVAVNLSNNAATILTGTKGTPGSTNGTRAQGTFLAPYDVKLDKTGNYLFVMDQGNVIIRTVLLPGKTMPTSGNSGTGTGTGALTTSTFTGMDLWLDGADPLGTGTAPAANTLITSWKDKSGNNYHATGYSSGSPVPAYVSGGGISIDGANKNQWFVISPYAGTNNIETGFVVLKFYDITGAGSAAVQGTQFQSQDILMGDGIGNRELVYYNGVVNLFDGGRGQIITQPPPPVNTTTLLEYSLNPSATAIYMNGTLNASGPGFSPNAQTSLTIGKNSATAIVGPGSLLRATICEIIIYNSVVSTSTREYLEGYLAWKWGIQGSLPSGHPYASAAPGSSSGSGTGTGTGTGSSGGTSTGLQVVTVYTSSVVNGSNNSPGLAFDPAGQNLYITDYTTTTIWKVVYATGVSSSFYSFNNGMNLWGITFDVNGNMYVGGNATGNIYRVTSAAAQTLLGNVGGNAGELTVGSDGYLYVAGANRVSRISSTGTVTPITASFTDGSRTTFDNAASVRMGPDGNLYVLDCNNGRVVRMSKTGANAITLAGSTTGITGHLDGTGTNARLTFPIGSCMDSNGNLYTCDVNGYYIRKVTPAGVVTTVAGSGVTGSTDGPVLSATLQAVGICIGPDGNLWFRNIPNSSVRKVTMSSPLSPQTLYAFTGT